ncbi:hypothetical protein DSL72_007641 [Monilinia vaccinii-corymbosi]|uniref:Uncharacterized protein n=1 Tax=Monilinia vaccinii-corymbosi TaxID=61207 RepID=A0A8A3PIC5_9HELO|nr:hypothetical protein DSL72_007641 [Monilinia vaccinii-corymbosi]
MSFHSGRIFISSKYASQATPRTQSVDLVGSWDNFTKRYPMERDLRRSREQWRGCHVFDDIICDGDGSNSKKRTGGLKMASTYYYYYELDGGIEVHDTAIPFTTTCPYMPGQPVNILCVPVEVSPLRLQCGSVDSINAMDAKTLNPADKFTTPRAPPLKPGVVRFVSSSSSHAEVSLKRRPSSKERKLGWATKLFSGRRSRSSEPRSAEPVAPRRSSESDTSRVATRTSNSSCSSTIHQLTPIPPKPVSRAPSPIRVHDSIHNNLIALGIHEEIPEDDEDDANFAPQFKKFKDDDSFTRLCPTPSRRQASPTSYASKPLPQLPNDEFKSPLSPLFRPPPHSLTLPGSHFSVSTTSTALTSPTDSQFGFSDTSSMFDSYDESDLNEETGDTFTYNPMISEVEKGRFIGYSLPNAEHASEQTIREVSISRHTRHDAYPRDPGFGAGIKDTGRSALANFLDDMGYLGDTISDK